MKLFSKAVGKDGLAINCVCQSISHSSTVALFPAHSGYVLQNAQWGLKCNMQSIAHHPLTVWQATCKLKGSFQARSD